MAVRQLYLKHPDNTTIKHRFDAQLDDFEITLRDFMGDKGMLITDVERGGM